MRSPTEKECPGCKTRQKFYAGDVCYTCSTRLRDYPSMKATLDQMAGGASSRVHFGSRLPLPFGCFSAPSRERMAEALSKLLQASFATEVVEDGEVSDPWKERGASRMQLMGAGFFEVRHRDSYLCEFIASVPQEFESALRDFLNVTGTVMRECNAEGRAQGQNLLFQLNDGSLSLNDFTDRLERAQRGERG